MEENTASLQNLLDLADLFKPSFFYRIEFKHLFSSLSKGASSLMHCAWHYPVFNICICLSRSVPVNGPSPWRGTLQSASGEGEQIRAKGEGRSFQGKQLDLPGWIITLPGIRHCQFVKN